MNPVRVLLIATFVFAATLFADTSWSSDYAMHAYFNNRFLESKGNGISRIYADPMQVHDSMRLRITSGDTYRLEAVELIGVAMHEKPVAFSRTPHSALKSLPRSLTAFEQRALTELSAGETVSVYVGNPERFVVGALRAQRGCLQCHGGHKTGDLLGALSYRLTPAR
jgi:hypothetical protein